MPVPPPSSRRPDPGSHPALSYRPPPSLRAVRIGLVSAAVVAAVAVLYGAYWLIVATALRDGVDDWIAARRAEGYAIVHDDLALGGFPFVARVGADGPVVTAPGAAWSWRGARAAAEIDPLRPSRLAVSVAGAQTVVVGTGTGARTYRGDIGSLVADVAGTSGGLPAASLTVRGLDLAATDGSGAYAVGRLDVTGDSDPAAGAGEATYALAVEAADLRLPPAAGLPLGERIEAATADARLIGTLEPAPWPAALAAWRDAGGTIEVARLDLRHGPLALEANGTLALDAEMQPVGAFTARFEGFFEAVEALSRAGIIRRRDALTANLLLGALARRPDGGGPPVLSVPLTLQDRRLYAGPVPLVEVPPIAWE